MLWDRDPEVKSLNSVQISVVITFVEYFFKTCSQCTSLWTLGRTHINRKWLIFQGCRLISLDKRELIPAKMSLENKDLGNF